MTATEHYERMRRTIDEFLGRFLESPEEYEFVRDLLDENDGMTKESVNLMLSAWNAGHSVGYIDGYTSARNELGEV